MAIGLSNAGQTHTGPIARSGCGLVDSAAVAEVRTAALAAAVGVTRQTVANWVVRGLLPAPRRAHLGAHGSASHFPNYTIELGKYLRRALERATYGRVALEIAPLLRRDARWIDAQLAGGRPIESLLREPAATAAP